LKCDIDDGALQGKLPADFTTHDVDMIHTMLASVINETEGTTPGLWRRYFAILIEGLRHERRD
jgi:hypothetical protein